MPHCGKEFEQVKARYKARKYCSDKCSKAAAKIMDRERARWKVKVLGRHSYGRERAKIAKQGKEDRLRKRDCLRCGKSFISCGIHNRLCWACQAINSGRDMVTYQIGL